MNQVKALAAALVVLSAPASATDLTNIENVSSLNGADINITDSIDLNQNNLNSPNKVDGIDLDNPGPGIQLNGNKLAANASKFVDRNGDTMTGDLDMDGHDIVNVDALSNSSTPAVQFDGGQNIEVPNGNLDLSGNNINNTTEIKFNSNGVHRASIEPSSSSDGVRFKSYDETLGANTDSYFGFNVFGRPVVDGPSLKVKTDLSIANSGKIYQSGGGEYSLEAVDILSMKSEGEIQTAGTGSHSITIRDTSSTQDIARFNEGGDVEIPNGNLTLTGSPPNGRVLLQDDGGAQTLSDTVVTSSPSSGGEQSYAFRIDGEKVAKIYAEADGTGGIQNRQFRATGVTLSPGPKNRGQISYTFTDMYENNAGSLIINPRDGRGVSLGGSLNVNGNVDVSGNNINNIGTSNVDAVYDTGDDRVEIRSSGQENICIGNCGA